MAYTVFKDYSFAAAHFIPGHPGKCAHLHGHTYRVRVHIRAQSLDHLGMVVDFADLKAVLEEVMGPFDHRVLNELSPFDQLSPTAENIAGHVAQEVAARLGRDRLQVTRVEVWESETSCAAFEPE